MLPVTMLGATLGACGEGPGADDPQPGDPVAETLRGLGVDPSVTPRLDDEGDEMPPGYTPLGVTTAFVPSRELMILGTPLHPSRGHDGYLTVVEQVPEGLDDQGRQIYDTEVLFAPPRGETPWAEPPAGGGPRAAARADLDLDGLDEIAAVTWVPGAGALELRVYEDHAASYAPRPPVTIAAPEPRGIALEGGDVDGDGLGDLIVALTFDDRAQLIVLRSDGGTLAPTNVVELPRTLIGGEPSVDLATGNLDHDPGDEMVVVINEVEERPGAPRTGTARYHVIDDAAHDFATVAGGPVAVASDALNRSAVTAGVALGDIDGDQLAEPIFAGLTHFDPDGDCDYSYLVLALDDLERGLAVLGGGEHDAGLRDACRAGDPLELGVVHVNTLDLDANGAAEIQVNQLVFNDFATAPPFTRAAGMAIDPRSLFEFDDGYTGRFDRHTSTMITGDFTADGREDIAFYARPTRTLEIWGLGEPDRVWMRQASVALAPGDADASSIAPLLVAPNVDHDSLVLSYEAGEHRVVFTEPVLLAALAAAPCYRDRGQEAVRCRTEFGTADTLSVLTEDALTITATASVGFHQDFAPLGVKVASAEAIARIQGRASRITSSAYMLTTRIVYTTGPIEDTVIFTSIPYDQYSYTIRSHPDPELIGSTVVVSLPRSPVELQVERAFYNDHIVDGVKVDEAIFGHTAGDPRSYPTRDDKKRLLEGGGYEIGPQAVGLGGGLQTLTINVHEATGDGVAYSAEFSLDLKTTTGGLVRGFSVGVGHEHSLRVSHGQESTYVGAVANLPEDQFATSAYEFGLFTYIHQDPSTGQELEIVNYWVE